MAKRKIDAELKTTIDKYIEKISHHYKIDAVYLFGSHAKGTTHEWSDIDLAIISNDIKDETDDMGNLFYLTRGVDTRIEPHPINTAEFRNRETSFIHEIINTGIPIYGNIIS